MSQNGQGLMKMRLHVQKQINAPTNRSLNQRDGDHEISVHTSPISRWKARPGRRSGGRVASHK